MEIENYGKQLEELLNKGLTIDEADAVIYGDITLEEALKKHVEKPLDEALDAEEVKMETYEDAENIMRVVREITAKESE
jgi:hypothetical protein